jgi:aspartyl-tRNA(Asn)/glutamyl-tRNA(Gln) amidotransferase subunit C
MSLTISEVKHIADLARLQLSSEEIKLFQQQLSEILEYVNQLREVDTSGIPPTARVSQLKGILRFDEVKPGLTTDELMRNAPQKDSNQFRVPPIFD